MSGDIAAVAKERVGESLVSIFLKQAWYEFKHSSRTAMSFRRIENEAAVRAYCAMTQAEFEGINARQKWANWRTIPRTLAGRLPDRPCKAVDLCSGSGDSTEVLAYYLPPGSEILGLEFNPAFAARAAGRKYRRPNGARVRATFRVQSVLEIFCDASGEPLEDSSVDLVNSCGALGIHFDAAAIERLAGEVARVLRPGGLAAVDSGTHGVRATEMVRIFEARGFRAQSFAKSCFLDRFTQVGLVKITGY